MKVAYLVNQYPKISHTFIRREILALERIGFSIPRISVRGWDAELVDPTDKSERSKTFYVLQHGAFALAAATARQFIANPRSFFSALRAAKTMMSRAREKRWVHVIYLMEACAIARYCARERVEHIHAHFGTNSAEVAMLAGHLTRIPFSFTVHGPDEFDRPEALGLGLKVAAASFVAAISSFTRSQLLRWSAIEDWSKVKVVRCGIEGLFDAQVDPIADDCHQFVCVARLGPQKGQLLLVEAVAKLAKTHPGIRLVFVGDGELRQLLESSIAGHGLTDKVKILGWQGERQVAEQIVASRALVLSSFAEGLPVVLMEAMALGRPVLTTSVAGIPELVRHGIDGWVYPPGSVDAIVENMRMCLDTPAHELTRMGEKARERCRSMHNIDDIVGGLAQAFRSPAVGAPR
jgi:colanic acid/amylovoran biosynthesis glycosyltransferase